MIQVNISPKFRAVITEISDGNIDQRFESKFIVKNNLNTISKKLAIRPSKIIAMQQVHETKVQVVGKSQAGSMIKDSDGLITNQTNLPLMLRIADCIPIFLFDSKNKAIGLVHSGWRGTIGKILLVAIEKMMLEYNSKPKDLRILLGPSIQKCCNFHKSEPLQTSLPEWKEFIKKADNQWKVDLSGFVIKTALEAGVIEKNIKDMKICTFTNKKYYSYKRSKNIQEREGRFAAIVYLNFKN